MLSKKSAERAVSLSPRLMRKLWAGQVFSVLADADVRLTPTPPTKARNSRARRACRWPDKAQSQGLEVLHNRCEMETRHALPIGL